MLFSPEKRGARCSNAPSSSCFGAVDAVAKEGITREGYVRNEMDTEMGQDLETITEQTAKWRRALGKTRGYCWGTESPEYQNRITEIRLLTVWFLAC
ncbi:hypothetical protein L596_028358 [Steinernema carpocapsae]|uniref:Uncharacterized protein n=1 Tax=Steinernema carpocapsae TaxID=34508 RepID=A0A4U5LY93_STECR|nr:hypothetical protein L596_028358 [Steinernema carpocapsae]